MDEVNGAIDTLKARHPEYFDGNTIKNVGAYYVGLIKQLDQQGICAGFDGEELTVKTSNDFSDQYKLQTSSNLVRRFYVGSCYPAIFPASRSNPDPSPPGCQLSPSTDITCGVMDSRYLGLVETAVSQVIAQKPELFDLSSYPKGHPDWPKVKDLNAYQMAVIDVLRQKGFCGKSGEEIVVKRSNDFTEHFDINYQDAYVRNGPGIYRGTCYPAAF